MVGDSLDVSVLRVSVQCSWSEGDVCLCCEWGAVRAETHHACIIAHASKYLVVS